MIDDIKTQEKKVIINSTEGVFEKEFKEKIQKHLIFSGRALILLNYMDYSKTYGNRNIFCLNERGDVLWQIKDPNLYRVAGSKETDAAFVGMRITKDNKLRATSWNSFTYDVDIETGALSNGEFTK